ncbi:unnamed protein product [Closterium sp. Naga37s-1]|nr:unnamed protein product [Closterium sp. Naga37s-1]
MDRPELQKRVAAYCEARGQQEHWTEVGPFTTVTPLEALGSNLMGNDKCVGEGVGKPVFFDHMVLQMVPVVALIVHRLIENDAMETADRLLALYNSPHKHLLTYHPSRFAFVRDTLAYFYPALPNQLVIQLFSILDLTRIPFAEAFLRQMDPSLSSAVDLPPLSYFLRLLETLCQHIIPSLPAPLPATSAPSPFAPLSPLDYFHSISSPPPAPPVQPVQIPGLGSFSPSSFSLSSPLPTALTLRSPPFYEHLDTGGFAQLVLETAVLEILSLPLPPPRNSPVEILCALLAAAAFPPLHPNAVEASAAAAAAAAAASAASAASAAAAAAAAATGDAGGRGGGGGVRVGGGDGAAAGGTDPMMVDGAEMMDDMKEGEDGEEEGEEEEEGGEGHEGEVEDDVGAGSRLVDMLLMDPSWAIGNATCTELSIWTAAVHAMMYALPFDRIEGTHALLVLQRPIRSPAHLRLVFRLVAPILPRTPISKSLFAKVRRFCNPWDGVIVMLHVLLCCMCDGPTSHSPPSFPSHPLPAPFAPLSAGPHQTIALLFSAIADVFGVNSSPQVTGPALV